MKYTLRNTTVLAALILGSLAAYSQTVNVPFAFEAKGIAFPAGKYEVGSDANHGFLSLRNKQYPAKQLLWVAHPEDASANGDAVLSFDKAGSVAVLKSIQNLQWKTSDLSGAPKKSSEGEQRSQGTE